MDGLHNPSYGGIYKPHGQLRWMGYSNDQFTTSSIFSKSAQEIHKYLSTWFMDGPYSQINKDCRPVDFDYLNFDD